MKRIIIFFAAITVCVIFSYGFFKYSKEPVTDEVVVSIKPVHAMVCALTKGIAKPKLLLDGSFSPHHFQLTPSMVEVLQKAKLVIWIGPAYEMPLYNHFRTIWAKVLTLQFDPNIKLKTIRSGILWEHHCHEHNHAHDHSYDDLIALDGHIWLDPDNMILMLENTTEALQKIYPEHKELILKNSAAYKEKLNSLKESLSQKLKPYTGCEYIMQHDGTQYFDAAFGTRAIATLTVDPAIPVSAAHILKIRQAISERIINPKCFFSETQFDDSLLIGYANNIGLGIEKLDYLGAQLEANETAYETIMHNFADAMIKGFNSK
jgi:zinc transport system substrate-binding protein